MYDEQRFKHEDRFEPERDRALDALDRLDRTLPAADEIDAIRAALLREAPKHAGGHGPAQREEPPE